MIILLWAIQCFGEQIEVSDLLNRLLFRVSVSKSRVECSFNKKVQLQKYIVSIVK